MHEPRDGYGYGYGGDESVKLDRYQEIYRVYSDPHGPGRRERSYPGGAAHRPRGNPLRVIHVSLAMLPAGIDKWLTALIRHSDPRRLEFLRCVVTSQYVDWKQLARVGVPVEVGRRDSIRRACADCDLLLISDPGEAPDWVEDVAAKLCVFVAHGDGPWTRLRMERLASVVHHVVAVSGRVQRTVCDGFPCTVIPNGVDPLHLARCRPKAAPDDLHEGHRLPNRASPPQGHWQSRRHRNNERLRCPKRTKCDPRDF